MNCILLSVLLAMGEKQCNKWNVNLESLDLHNLRGGVWVKCINKQTRDSMYIEQMEIKARCIDLRR